MIGAIDIMEAKAAWETTEWGLTVPQFRAFVSFPSDDTDDPEYVADLLLPFTGHRVETSECLTNTVNAEGSIEVTDRHLVWTYVIFAESGDKVSALARRDALWRKRYEVGFMLHLRQSISATVQASVVESLMGMIRPAGVNLFNKTYVGIQVPNTITITQSYSTGW